MVTTLFALFPPSSKYKLAPVVLLHIIRNGNYSRSLCFQISVHKSQSCSASHHNYSVGLFHQKSSTRVSSIQCSLFLFIACHLRTPKLLGPSASNNVDDDLNPLFSRGHHQPIHHRASPLSSPTPTTATPTPTSPTGETSRALRPDDDDRMAANPWKSGTKKARAGPESEEMAETLPWRRDLGLGGRRRPCLGGRRPLPWRRDLALAEGPGISIWRTSVAGGRGGTGSCETTAKKTD